MALGIILRGIETAKTGGKLTLPRAFLDASARLLAEAPKDPAFAAEALALPSEGTIAEQMEVVDPDAIHAVRNELKRKLPSVLRQELLEAYRVNRTPGPYSPDAASAGKRALRNTALALLMELDEPEARALCMKQFEEADNMTDALAALTMLANCDCPEREWTLDAFYAKWKDEPLVVDKWLAVQATSRLPDTLARIERLMRHEAFDIRNPNKVYALIRAFCANHVRFHAADGSGYAFGADRVLELDPLNPQIAARIARAFDRWKKFDAGRQARARAALERIRAQPGLSKDVAEVVTKALA
jgi:aminopeptidase N